jgi:imidazolonepropionase-like amidohydrolase
MREFVLIFIFTWVSGFWGFALASALGAPPATPTPHDGSCSVLEVHRYFDGEKLMQGKKSFIVVEKGVIADIAAKRPLARSHCEQIDLSAFFVSPGLIDGHTHLLFTDRNFGRDFSKEVRTFTAVTAKRRMDEARGHALSMLEAGFTTVRDLGNSGQFLDLELREEIRSERAPGPRIFASGPGVAVKEGQFAPGTPQKMVAREYRTISNAKEAAAVVGALKKSGVDLIKAYADNDPNPHAMPLETLSALIREASRSGLPVAVHATNEEAVKTAISAGAHSIEHAYEISDASLKKMAEVGTILVPTDLGQATCRVLSTKAPGSKPASCENDTKSLGRRLKSALDLGVVIAFGSDAYVELEKNHQDRGRVALDSLASYVEGGLTPLQALRSATSGGARLVKREDLGKLQVGAAADIIAFAKDPLSQDSLSRDSQQKFYDIRSVAFVMKGGRIHKLSRPVQGRKRGGS